MYSSSRSCQEILERQDRNHKEIIERDNRNHKEITKRQQLQDLQQQQQLQQHQYQQLQQLQQLQEQQKQHQYQYQTDPKKKTVKKIIEKIDDVIPDEEKVTEVIKFPTEIKEIKDTFIHLYNIVTLTLFYIIAFSDVVG